MSNKVWMSGCLNVWMSGCLDVWMSGCLNVWMSGCLDVWMSERLNVWISDCLNVWLSDCLCFSTSRHSDNQASRHSDIQTSRHSDIQTSMLQMSRKERTNLEDIIRDSMRSWSSPRPSRIPHFWWKYQIFMNFHEFSWKFDIFIKNEVFWTTPPACFGSITKGICIFVSKSIKFLMGLSRKGRTDFEDILVIRAFFWAFLSSQRCSRCPEKNVQIWKISFAIQCDLGHPRAPPESQKNTACPVILDSGGARGAQKKARMTRISSKYVRPFLDIPIKNLIDFGLKSQKSGSFFQNVLDIWLENDHFQEKIQNFKDFSTFRWNLP